MYFTGCYNEQIDILALWHDKYCTSETAPGNWSQGGGGMLGQPIVLLRSAT